MRRNRLDIESIKQLANMLQCSSQFRTPQSNKKSSSREQPILLSLSKLQIEENPGMGRDLLDTNSIKQPSPHPPSHLKMQEEVAMVLGLPNVAIFLYLFKTDYLILIFPPSVC